MNNLQLFAETLDSVKSRSFRFRPATSELIQTAVKLGDLFGKLTETERFEVKPMITPDVGKKLLSASGFMAEWAINQNDSSLINSAVLLHIIEDFQIDYRENVRYLVLIVFAGDRLGVDFSIVASTLLPLATERAKRGVLDFMARTDALNNLSSFGMREDISNGVFRFVPVS